MEPIVIELQVRGPEALNDFVLNETRTAIAPGIELSLDHVTPARGEAEAVRIVTLLLDGVVTPVALGIASNWLYDRLSRNRHRITRVKVDDEEIEIIPGEIERVTRRRVEIISE